MDTTVAVIAGGLSFEREVSLRSGRRVADALRDRGYGVTQLDADEQLVESLRTGGADAVFLALHGRFGEDGTVAALLGSACRWSSSRTGVAPPSASAWSSGPISFRRR